ncbi:MAG: hypothetical protein R8P61_28290 [Bacteroidia bacterium]|nr:hypothetical protein [Bacteroidia bacterium]
MSTFWPDLTSSDQWEQQIKNGRYLKDLTRGQEQLERAINDQSELIAQSTRAQLHATTRSTEVVAKNLQAGFTRLGNNQEVMIELLSQIMGDSAALVEETKRTNQYLESVIQRLAIPDSQKEREYKLKEGFKHLHNSTKFPDRFHDAYRNFSQAIEIEPADYFALYRMGIIHFFSPHHANLTKAENYFRRAGEYALAESSDTSRRSQTALGGEIALNIIKEHAGDAFNMQARCQFLLGNVSKALNICTTTVRYFPKRIDTLFEKARLEVRLRKDNEAANTVDKLLNQKLEYCILIANDKTLGNNPTIQGRLIARKDKYRVPVLKEYEKAKQVIIPQSKAKQTFHNLGQLLATNTLLDSFDAHKLASQKLKWTILHYPVFPNDPDFGPAVKLHFKNFTADIEGDSYGADINQFTQHIASGPIWKEKTITTSIFPFIQQERDAHRHLSSMTNNLRQAREATFSHLVKNIPTHHLKDMFWGSVVGAIILFVVYWALQLLKWILFGWKIFDYAFNLVFIIALILLAVQIYDFFTAKNPTLKQGNGRSRK